MDRNQYAQILAAIRFNVADRDPNGQYIPRRDGLILHEIKIRSQGASAVSLPVLYRAKDFYILGFVANETLFRFRDCNFNLPNFTSPTALSFGSSYKELGIDRTSKYSLDLDTLTAAIHGLAETLPASAKGVSKPHAAALVVGFAEALRFSDVMLKISDGRSIDPQTDLDWNARSKVESDFYVQIRIGS